MSKIEVLTRAQSIILRELSRLGRICGENNGNIIIRCPNPEHDDSSPSCSVYVGTDGKAMIGWTYCFGCGFSKPWNTTAGLINAEKIDTQSDTKQDRGRSRVSPEVRDKLLPDPNKDLDWYIANAFYCGMGIDFLNQDWRKMPASLMRDIGAKLAYNTRQHSLKVVLPVEVNGALVGAIAAEWERKGDENPYKNSPGEWAKSLGLFPYDFAKKKAKETGYLVLVEGPRDALRLLSLGIPAVSIIGARNWSDAKRKIISRLIEQQGVKIILAFDGDKAGVRVSNDVVRSFKELYGSEWKNNLRVFRLKEWSAKYTQAAQKKAKLAGDPNWQDIEVKIDPGNMPKRVIRELRALAISLTGKEE